jgi:hypothetical protein
MWWHTEGWGPLTLGCALAGLCVAAQPAAATGGLVVVPRPATATGLSYFKVRGRPAASVTAGSIELVNPSSKTLRIALAAVDGATLSTLGSLYLPAGSARRGSTRWLRLRATLVTIAAGRRAVVPIAVAIPARARPGDYLSGVSVEALGQRIQTARSNAGASTASAVRYAIGVETSLPGPRRPRIAFTGATMRLQPAGLVFLLDARNLGNAILQGVYGRVQVAREGHTVVSRSIPPGTFVAHTAIAYHVPAFGERPHVGTRYGITAWMRYRGGIARLQRTIVFGSREASVQGRYARRGRSTATAWWKLALLAAVLAYALFVTGALLRSRRRARRGAAGRRGERPNVPSGR